MAFKWSDFDKPMVICPPMDGITDNAYRELVAEMGGSDVLFAEFVNVKGLIYENPKTLFELRYTENQRPIIAQLFGSDPKDFFQASQIVAKMNFDAIDINMGCPAHKVASKGGGCALMGNTQNAKEIVINTINGAREINPEIDVSCKMRLGVDEKTKVFEHAYEMIDAGAKTISIHGRTLKQMYTGFADWDIIRDFVKRLHSDFPDSKSRPKVNGSGDVKTFKDILERLLTTGVDGVMIGRGSFGNPWIFEKEKTDQIRNYAIEYGWPDKLITKEEFEKLWYTLNFNDESPSFDEIKRMAIHHSKLMEKDKGQSGIIQMRKHLSWYFHSFEGAKDLRNKLVRVNTLDEIKEILS